MSPGVSWEEQGPIQFGFHFPQVAKGPWPCLECSKCAWESVVCIGTCGTWPKGFVSQLLQIRRAPWADRAFSDVLECCVCLTHITLDVEGLMSALELDAEEPRMFVTTPCTGRLRGVTHPSAPAPVGAFTCDKDVGL